VAAPRIDPLDRMNWTSSGGWHQEYGTIYYKSTGHADPLLKAWLEHVLEDVRDPLRLATLREGFGFDKGALSPATGHCLKCHTIEERRDQQGSSRARSSTGSPTASTPLRQAATARSRGTTTCHICWPPTAASATSPSPSAAAARNTPPHSR
jgi:hypothetical protein